MARTRGSPGVSASPISAALEGLCSTSSRTISGESSWTGRVADGRLVFAIDFNRHLFRPERIASLASHFEAALRDLLAHCTSRTRSWASPSDFPLCDVSRHDLDLWQADLGEIRALPTACGGEQPAEPADLQFPEPGDAAVGDGTVTAVVSTSCGDLTIELDPIGAPETVNSFAFLADEGYFEGTAFHRIMSGFMVQGGDPTGTGAGGPGYSLPDELPAQADFVYTRGTVAMANAGAGTGGSQFFVMFGDTPLPPSYSVFGKVIDGLDVLDAIEAVPVGLSDTGELSSPLEAVYIESVTIR